MNESFRTADAIVLAHALRDARGATLELLECFLQAGLDDAAALPAQDGVSPPLWEFGHIAWFAEWAVLRGMTHDAPALLSRGDDWFDPARVPRAARWQLPLPGAGALKTYCHEVLDRVQDRLARLDTGTDEALYPYRLALAYEDRRSEALAALLQTLGVPAPARLQAAAPAWAQGEIRFPGGTLQMGGAPEDGFAFDLEQPRHACRVAAFTLDSALVSNLQFEEFVEDGGYREPRFWSPSGHRWLQAEQRVAPRDWRRDGGQWRALRFGRASVLAPHQPVRHLSLYEAQAYCVWAERRLPTEAEWEYAAQSGHPALRWGDLWEWTCTPFETYPGFVASPWRQGALPYDARHQAVRGASLATPARSRWARQRRFLLPHCNWAFVGFRTCAF